ncbi:MAG: EAL domain-containing protein [bacterium]|nr:EAL domain-containing protein [bacterium]
MSDRNDPEILRDLLTQAKRAYEEEMSTLLGEKELAQLTLASIGYAVVTTDAATSITSLNPAAEELTGWLTAEAVDRCLDEVLRLLDEDEEAVTLDLSPCLRDGRTLVLSEDLTLERRDGQRFALEGHAAAIRDRAQRTIGMVLVLRDVSEQRLTSLRLTRAAHYDGLTGLLNRETFDRHLRTALEWSRGGGASHVLCYMDLDQFRVINDTCGHAAGDLLLQWISSLIRERVRDGDVLARLGGDEIGLLLAECPMEVGERIAEDIHREIQAFRFVWRDRSFTVGISIGLVCVNCDFKELADLLGAAEHACYLAKQKGRRRSWVYQQDDAEIRRHHGQMNWLLEIQRALDEDLFVLYWQRIQPLTDSTRDHRFFEVLLRMKGKAGTIHQPGDFLLAAERYGLMPAIDRWVVKRTFEMLTRQPREFLDRLHCCSINLSGASIGDESVLERIEEELARTGVPAGKICFEITETAAVRHLGMATRMITQLSARDCRWALDDFGSGMSSYRYLRELPVDFIKIDGNIVGDLTTSPLSRAMVKSINQIAHVMGVRTVAEAVSSEAMVRELEEMGVDYAQGFWIAKPCPIRL